MLNVLHSPTGPTPSIMDSSCQVSPTPMMLPRKIAQLLSTVTMEFALIVVMEFVLPLEPSQQVIEHQNQPPPHILLLQD